jgi:hypothetical protein
MASALVKYGSRSSSLSSQPLRLWMRIGLWFLPRKRDRDAKEAVQAGSVRTSTGSMAGGAATSSARLLVLAPKPTLN